MQLVPLSDFMDATTAGECYTSSRDIFASVTHFHLENGSRQ